MNAKECELQLNQLIIDWDEDKATKLNATDIEAIKQLQQENQQLKMINNEYERLNKENERGFKITSVKEYNIDELLKCKNNWNELKKYIDKNKLILNNPNILDFYMKIHELEGKSE